MRTMFQKFFSLFTFIAFLAMGLFVACKGSSTPDPAPPPVPPKYSISGTVSGSVVASVSVSIAPTPTGVTPWVTTDSKGVYTFANIPNGTFVLTPYITGHTFTPTTATVVVNGKDVTGVNFNSPLPTLNTGKLLYASGSTDISGFAIIYSLDLATGVKSTIYKDVSGMGFPDLIVPLRGTNKKIAYRIDGTNYGYDGIWNYDLITGVRAYGVPVEGIIVGTYWTTTFDSFDVGAGPNNSSFAAVTLKNTQGVENVFIVNMNGTQYWSPVTTDVLGNGAGNNTSPVIAASDVLTGQITVLFIKNGTEVWKGTANVLNDVPTPPTLYKSNAMASTRPMSVNADYTLLAWTKNVNSVGHIVVTPLAGGADLDLGPGNNPSWSFNGNGMLLYTSGNALWAVNPDGTGKIQVPTPSDLRPGALSTVVFGPAGF